MEIFHHSEEWKDFFEKFQNEKEYFDYLFELSGLEKTETEEEIVSDFARGKKSRAQELQKAVAALQEGGKTDVVRAKILARWAEKENPEPQDFYDYMRAFFTEKGTAVVKLATNDVLKKNPETEGFLEYEKERAIDAMYRIRMNDFIRRQMGFAALMREFWEDVQAAKQQEFALTYDDLIIKTRDLLQHSDKSDWIKFKLDFSIDHLLLDEAQDTSPAQWQVVEAILEEFLSGSGSREGIARTVLW